MVAAVIALRLCPRVRCVVLTLRDSATRPMAAFIVPARVLRWRGDALCLLALWLRDTAVDLEGDAVRTRHAEASGVASYLFERM